MKTSEKYFGLALGP